MILKVRTVDKGWAYYQIDGRIKHRNLTSEQYNNGCKLGVFDRREIDVDLFNGKREINRLDGVLKTIRFEYAKMDNKDFILYTNLAVCLLNDKGKTIERIN